MYTGWSIEPPINKQSENVEHREFSFLDGMSANNLYQSLGACHKPHIDLTNMTTSPSVLGTASISGNLVHMLFVSGNVAYKKASLTSFWLISYFFRTAMANIRRNILIHRTGAYS